MSNTYKALNPQAEDQFGKGVFEYEFSPANEQDHLAAGVLEIVPRTYKILSDNYEAGEQDEEVQLALQVEHEAALIAGGHIERVDKKPPTKKTKKD